MLLPTRLKGLLIGNGWISPREQYPAYLTYLEREGLLKKGTQAHRNVLAATQKCNATLAAMDAKNGAEGSKGMVLVPDCEAILGAMSAATMKDGKCLNSYDTREYFACGTQWPHELTEVTKYLRVRSTLSLFLCLSAHSPQLTHDRIRRSETTSSKPCTPSQCRTSGRTAPSRSRASSGRPTRPRRSRSCPTCSRRCPSCCTRATRT